MTWQKWPFVSVYCDFVTRFWPFNLFYSKIKIIVLIKKTFLSSSIRFFISDLLKIWRLSQNYMIHNVLNWSSARQSDITIMTVGYPTLPYRLPIDSVFKNVIFLQIVFKINWMKWRPPSLSELTQIIFHMELIHLGSKTSKYCFLQYKLLLVSLSSHVYAILL